MATLDEAELVASLRIEFIEATRSWGRALTTEGVMESWIAANGNARSASLRRAFATRVRGWTLAGKEAYVHNLYVRTGYRSGGIARKLMRALLDWCKQNGYHQFRRTQ